MKNKVYYSSKPYVFEGQTVIKENEKVKVIADINGSNLLFEGDVEGCLSKEVFHSIFSPFRLDQIVFHMFYGIGQIVKGDKLNRKLAVSFFENPERKYEIGDVIKEKDLI